MNPTEKTSAGRRTPSLALFELSDAIRPKVVTMTKTKPTNATT